MNILFLIPARGGSKGVPGKNIKPLNGTPLIYYTIDAARSVSSDEHICLSTDSFEIKQKAVEYGLAVPFMRPESLAQDTSGAYEVFLHAIDFYARKGQHYDALVVLQPTSPFRKAAHIKEALSLYHPGLEMVASVKETSSNPYYVLFEENEQGYLVKSKSGNYQRRQDCPKVWEYNGAIYVINVQAMKQRPIHQFTRIRKYVMSEAASVDIDTLLDWEFCEFLLSRANIN